MKPKKSPFCIRQAIHSDSEALSKISRATFYETYVQLNPENSALLQAYVDETFSEQKIAEELQKTEVTFYLLEAENELIGYAKTKGHAREARLEIEKLYLINGHKGQGHGKKLFLHIKNQALSNGQKSLCLSVYDQNKSAIEFYIQLGFKKISEKEFYFNWNGFEYKDRDWILELIL
jgi:ribosomal protein S18 acetylase RimI-like enzyme